jgi:hypothetical protein
MNVKQAGGWGLLFIMLMMTYGLFGTGGYIGDKPAAILKTDNTSLNETTPMIKAYHGATFEEKATVDLGCVGLMALLIIIRTLLMIPDKIYPEKGSKEELEEIMEDIHDR